MSQTREYVPGYFAEARLLPNGFKYPASYLAFAASGRSHVGPVNEDWLVLEESQIEKFFGYVKAASPEKALVPFMRVNGDDGVACFDADSLSEDPLVYVCNVFHNFGCWGSQKTFSEWLSEILADEERDAAP